MLRRPPRSTRTDTLFPYTTLFRSNLKNTLGQIEADCGNLHGGWLHCSGLPDSNPSWHSDAVSGSHPPHLLWVESGRTGRETDIEIGQSGDGRSRLNPLPDQTLPFVEHRAKVVLIVGHQRFVTRIW